MSNTDESVSNSNGEVRTERVEAIAHELKIPTEEAERMIDRAADCWY